MYGRHMLKSTNNVSSLVMVSCTSDLLLKLMQKINFGDLWVSNQKIVRNGTSPTGLI